MKRLICVIGLLALASAANACRSATRGKPVTAPPVATPTAATPAPVTTAVPSIAAAPTATRTVPIMGSSRLSASQLAAWFELRARPLSGRFSATVAVETLAAYYLEEGAAEGVAGDVAFVQGVLETGWFRFGGTITGAMNNFAGIGATDRDPHPASFPDGRAGVRAQIQHLRAYADASASTCTVPPLRSPCVDPRFSLVRPKGKAPNWNQLGSGNWATSTTYAASILALYNDALALNGLR
jgi:hypothetical protein